MTLPTWLRPRPATTTQPAPRARLGVHRLEAREVPAVDLVSALGVGNETGASRANDVAVDAAGNSYLAGYFSGTADFDPARTHPGDADLATARGTEDAFVAKYAPDDTLVWVRRMGGDAVRTPERGTTDNGTGVAVDAGGNVVVTGWFEGSADFGPVTRASAGLLDGFVTKLSPAGAVLWANRWGGGNDDRGKAAGVDAAGNVTLLGSRDYWTGTGWTVVNDQNGLDVLKFGPTGAGVWAKWVGTRQLPSSPDLEVDAAGNAFVSGSFNGGVDFDPGSRTRYSYSGPSHGGFVLKLDRQGAFGWVSPFVGQTSGSTHGFAAAQSLALDGGGNVVVGGYYGGSVDFDPGAGTRTLPTGGRAFVAKLTAGGGLTWVRALEGSGTTFVNGLAVDAAGGIYATGQFRGTADFDPGAGTQARASAQNAAGTADSSDAFVLKLDAAGNYGWVETFGGAGDETADGVAVGPGGDVRTAGGFQGTVDFDPDPLVTFDLTAPGAYSNGYLVRLRQS